MKELEPSRRLGEITDYEEDPFDLGMAADQAMMVVPDFLPMLEELRLRESKSAVVDTKSATYDLIKYSKVYILNA